jgi:outer membrane protein assembly factor BamD
MTDYTFPLARRPVHRSVEREGGSRTAAKAAARWCGLLAVIAILAAACGGNKPPVVPAGNAQPDQFLFQRGDDAMKRSRWVDARQYYQQIVDNYPQSPLRPDAKLGVGDSYLGEGGEANLVLAENEFKEFITFYPTSARVDYAQYKLAMSHFMRMRAPERDQTETVAAVREFEVFFDRYPNSMLTMEVRAKWREARNRLSEASYKVGLYYFRARWYTGAIDRFKEVLKEDPGYPNRDAVYYYLAESLLKADKKAEAAPYYDRLVKEFDRSDYLVDARRKLETLAAQ